ncbi:MAG TPA: hypothetical protein VJP77_05615 [Planctomycetota bacterium]|nr:hypothetical protein [Planctomycetota bacterium]
MTTEPKKISLRRRIADWWRHGGGANLGMSAEARQLVRQLGTWEDPSSRATWDRRPRWRANAARGNSSRKARRARFLWVLVLVAVFAWTTPGVLPWLWRQIHAKREAPVVLGWSFVAVRGTAGDRTSDTTISMNPSANLVVGAIVVVLCASDNVGTTDSETSEHTVADSVGNKWHKVREHCSSSGAQDDGVTGSVWLCKVTTQIGTGATITLTTSASQTAKCIQAIEVSSTAGAWDCIDVQVDAGTDASPTAASLTIKSAAVLALGCVFSESSDTAISAEDADYTSRQWVRSGSSGGSGANVCCGIATRIATLTGDTYAPTLSTSTDHVGMVVLLREAATKTRTRLVKSSGGHYTSLSSWESGMQADLTSVEEIRQAELWDFSDTSAMTFDGWTTSSTYYIRAYTPSDERHDGTAGTGYRLQPASGNVMIVAELFVRVEGIEITVPSGSFGFFVEQNAGNDGDVRFGYGLVHGGSIGILQSNSTSGTGHKLRVWNTIVYGCTNNAVLENDADSTLYAYNVTACDCGTGGTQFVFARFTGTFQIKNCVAQNPNVSLGGSSQHYNGTFTNAEYNLSGDTTAPGTNSRTSKTVTFIAAGSNNFKVASSDAEAKNFGKDVSADSDLAFSDDILGTTRPVSSSWDMGAHEAEAGATNVTPSVATAAGTAPTGTFLLAQVPAVAAPAGTAPPGTFALVQTPGIAAPAGTSSVLFTLSQIPGEVAVGAAAALVGNVSISTIVIPDVASGAGTASVAWTLAQTPTRADLAALASVLYALGQVPTRADGVALATTLYALAQTPGRAEGAGIALFGSVSVGTVVMPAAAVAGAEASSAFILALTGLAAALGSAEAPTYALVQVPGVAAGAGTGSTAFLLQIGPGFASALASALGATVVFDLPGEPTHAARVVIEIFTLPPALRLRDAPDAIDVASGPPAGKVTP